MRVDRKIPFAAAFESAKTFAGEIPPAYMHALFSETISGIDKRFSLVRSEMVATYTLRRVKS